MYVFSCSAIIVDKLNFCSITFRPVNPICFIFFLSDNNEHAALTISSAELLGTNTPVILSIICSDIPPTLVEITGSFAAIYSVIVVGSPSLFEEKTPMSLFAKIAGISSLYPQK